MNRKPVKPVLQAAHRAINSLHLRSYEIYQPVLVAGTHSDSARDCQLRWDAIEKVLDSSGAQSLVDLGCSEGYYVVQAALKGLPFAMGVDFDQRRAFTCMNQVILNDLQHAGFMMGSVDLDFVKAIPRFDAVIFLSVLHHLLYQRGEEFCQELLVALREKVGKVMFFEMGQSDETKESWAKNVPDMGPDPHAWIEKFVLSAGFSKCEKIALAPAFSGQVDRAVFAVYP
ncbi:MAG: O-antigen chain-terminating methyltransferase [Hyphomicrobiaceae bacterium]